MKNFLDNFVEGKIGQYVLNTKLGHFLFLTVFSYILVLPIALLLPFDWVVFIVVNTAFNLASVFITDNKKWF